MRHSKIFRQFMKKMIVTGDQKRHKTYRLKLLIILLNQNELQGGQKTRSLLFKAHIFCLLLHKGLKQFARFWHISTYRHLNAAVLLDFAIEKVEGRKVEKQKSRKSVHTFEDINLSLIHI